MRKEPSLIEQAFWTIFGLIFGISVLYLGTNGFSVVGLTVIGIFLILLTSATMFWSYIIEE